MAGGEREATARMAKRVADDVFPAFGWRQVGGLNANFDCTSPEDHVTENHPSDVVFTYEDPYTPVPIYVQFDLKSYASGTLKASKIREALESMARSTACANRSEEWRNKYIDGTRPALCVGALFIYNHDASYDKSFTSVLRSAGAKPLGIPPNQRLVVFGPDDVAYLASVAKDMKSLRDPDKPVLPPKNQCFFFQPHLQRWKAEDPEWSSASLEMLTAPYFTVGYRRATPEPTEGYIVYYRNSGETVDEYLYIFDYLFKYQLLRQAVKVQIRMPFRAQAAPAIFEVAKDEYASLYAHFPEFRTTIRARLENITQEAVDILHPQHSYIEIGGL